MKIMTTSFYMIRLITVVGVIAIAALIQFLVGLFEDIRSRRIENPLCANSETESAAG